MIGSLPIWFLASELSHLLHSELSQLLHSELLPASYSNSDDIQAAGKENGIYILQSIDHGPFELGTTRDTLGTTPEGGVLLGPERPRTYDDLNDNDKKRFDADVRATNIVLQGLPKDIYKLINHNIEAKAIWDNVKMLLAGSELTKEDRESQLYDEFERFKMLPDVDNQPVRDLALNEDNIFQAYECDAFDLDVDDEPIAQSIFIANLSSARPANLKACPSNASILSEITVIDSTSADMGNSNVIPYEQYLTVNDVFVVPSSASSVPNDAYVLHDNDAYVPTDPLATELNIYKEQVAIYEQRAKFELTLRERKMDEQMSILIRDRNKKEENLKKELHSVKLQLNSTIQNNKIIEETVTALKQEFKQKETKFLTDFSNLKTLKDKLENKLYSQDQSIQTVHMMLKPTKLYDQDATAIGVQNPFYLRKAKKIQPALYDGDELLKTHHVPVIVTSSEEDLELAETTRIKMNEKMNDSVCVEKRVKIIPPNYSKENFMATFTPQTQLTHEQVFWSIEIKEKKAEDLKAKTPTLPVLPPATVYPPNTPVHLVPRTLPTTSQVNIGMYVITQLFWDFEKTCKKRITPTGITEGERSFEQTKRCYLTEVITFFNLLKEHFDEVQKSLIKEVRAMKVVFEKLEDEVDQNAIALKSGEIEQKNLLITNETLIAHCIAHDVFYTVTDSLRIPNYLKKIQNDDHNTMVKDFSKLEIAHLILQLKYQHLKENLENFKSKSSKDVPEFDVFFELGKRDDQIQGHNNTIRKLKAQISQLKANKSDEVSHLDYKSLDSQNLQLKETVIALQERLDNFKAKNEKVKQHYQELFNSIKITRVKTIEKTTSLQTEIKNLKTQLKGKMPCVTSNVATPKRNNRGVHHGYLNRLRDTLYTLREIVEEARSNRPSDNSLEYAYIYTKHSQELLEYVNASCPNADNKRDRFIATTPLTRKKHVTFADPLETLGNNTSKHVKQQLVQQTNAPIIPSTGVSTSTTARRSQPKRNTTNDKTLPANSVPKTKVEDHPRNNKSKLSKKNRVDSSISVRRTVFNMNSNSLCKTCEQCPLTRNTTLKVMPLKQWKPTGRPIPLGGQCPLVRSTALNSSTMLADPQANKTLVAYNLVVQIVLWYLDSGCSKHMTGDRSRLWNFVKKFIETVRFGNNHFGAIMGYGDYVIGDSVISRVYYVEGLGHNLFSVSQFCDSNLEVAFRKQSCFVRDLDGVNLIKGGRGTNLYTISVEDMMRSSPICLLSKASKNKSWLWHRSLSHLNFGTINDLARKDLVSGLPRFTWVKFLRSKDETPEFVFKLFKQLQVGLNKTVRNVRTDNGT
ncbi:integrase, catalytic region, zinc finger, CCHC-type containing protein [Tanacetum coccineum]